MGRTVILSRHASAALIALVPVAASLSVSPVYASGPGVLHGRTPAPFALGVAGVSWTVKGVKVSAQVLRSRPEPPKGPPKESSPRRTWGSTSPPSGVASNSPAPPARSTIAAANSPQALADEIVGPKITDAPPGFVPPDTMGAVGPTQFLFSVNGRFRGYNKTSPHTQIFDMAQTTFWSSVTTSGVSDAHVRYDPNTQRWFITEIDVPAGNNNLLLAVSDTSDLSTTPGWTFFQIPATGTTSATDNGCFADYDTPGIDQNGIYIGANMFGGVSPCTPATYRHSNLYVIQKSSALTISLNVTGFFDVATGTEGIATIQGVDSIDALTTGYAIGVKEDESPRQHLNVWQINNPATTTPTLSVPTTVAISAENGARGGVLSANNVSSANPTRPMDDIDDRLFSAVIRSGHLWTAHNLGVDLTGNSNSAVRTRDAVRWYDMNVSGLTLNQWGTVFDGAGTSFLEYWMGTVMVSGQGHVAMGLNRANSATVVQAGAVGRLAADPAGTMGTFSSFQSSTNDAYDDASFVKTPANRWGDYTYTSLDPCDDMTMWTTQEYVAGPSFLGIPVDWGVAAEKLQAPPPATPTTASPSSVQTGQSSVNVVVTGTSTGGSGFYDTPSSITDPCRKRISATVSGGVTLNSISYTDPTHITLNISTASSTLGSHTVTVMNPDGQSTAATAILTVTPAYVAAAVGTDNGMWVLQAGAPGFTGYGGVLLGAPAVVAIPQTSGPAVPLYIATGSDHALYARNDSHGWQSFSPPPTNCLDNPAGAVIAGTLYVACEGADHALWHAETAAPTGTNLPALNVSSWHSLGGVLVAGPAVGSVAGTPTYLVVGTDQHIYSIGLSSSFTRFSWAACIGHPALATFGSTSYFGCHGTDDALWYATNTGGGWSAPQSLGGKLVDGVGVAATASGPVFFVEGVGGRVWQRTISSGWTSDGGQVTLGVGASAL